MTRAGTWSPVDRPAAAGTARAAALSRVRRRTISGPLGDGVGGDVAERHRGPDGGTGTRVAVPHHGGAGVARRVQAGDDRAVRTHHPGARVGPQPALGAEVAR